MAKKETMEAFFNCSQLFLYREVIVPIFARKGEPGSDIYITYNGKLFNSYHDYE